MNRLMRCCMVGVAATVLASCDAPAPRDIVFASRPAPGSDSLELFAMPREGGPRRQLTNNGSSNFPTLSPDGRTIAFISNRDGNTALWVIDAYSGRQHPVRIRERRYLRPRRDLDLRVVDEAGHSLPARVSVTDSRSRFYAPNDAWIHADDLIVPERQAVETVPRDTLVAVQTPHRCRRPARAVDVRIEGGDR